MTDDVAKLPARLQKARVRGTVDSQITGVISMPIHKLHPTNGMI